MYEVSGNVALQNVHSTYLHTFTSRSFTLVECNVLHKAVRLIWYFSSKSSQDILYIFIVRILSEGYVRYYMYLYRLCVMLIHKIDTLLQQLAVASINFGLIYTRICSRLS